MKKNSKVYIAGHKGLVGSAIKRALEKKGYRNLIFKTRAELNLINEQATKRFFEKEKPEYVFLAAAKVGGILANDTYPADFIYENLKVQNNVIHSSYLFGVKKLLFLGSSCIYPCDSKQPIKEEYFMAGPLEKTNDAYAIAKIAGIKMCQAYNRQYKTNFISVMPANLYGPNDNFDLNSSHVLPALIRKFQDAKMKKEKEVIIWGTGKPKREFLHVDDLADACVYLMNKYNETEIVNVGTGEDIAINKLAIIIKKISGFKGKIINNVNKPDGVPRKLLDVSKIHQLGWKHKIPLQRGIKMTFGWFAKNEFKD
jgi:GDP-L-fucose synthase